MPEGSSPERPTRIPRRAFVRLGALGGAAAALAALTRFFNPHPPPVYQVTEPQAHVPEADKEKSVVHKKLEELEKILSSEINLVNNSAILNSIGNLKHSDEDTLKKYIAYRELPADDDESIRKETYFSIDGRQVEPPVSRQDIGLGFVTSSDGRVLEQSLVFYVNSVGKLITDPSKETPSNFNNQELKDLAKVVLKNPPQDLQWQTEEIDEGGWKQGAIAWVINEDKYTKTVSLGPDGLVNIRTIFKTDTEISK